MRMIGAATKSVVARTALVLGLVSALCFAGAAWMIQDKAAQVQEASAMKELEQLAQAEAAKVRGDATETLSRVRGLADATLTMMARGNAGRGEASELVHRYAGNDPAALGYWLEFEPDGFDGQDAKFARSWPEGEPDAATLEDLFAKETPDERTSNDAGRISIYWTRGPSGATSLQINTGAENSITVVGKDAPGYYTAVRERGDELMFEPYLDDVGDAKVLMTSLMVPLKVDGQFRGVAGADIALSAIQANLAKIRPYQRGVVRLLSPTGMVLAAPEAQTLGKPFSSDLAPVLAKLAKGEIVRQRVFDPTVSGEVFRVYVPVTAGRAPDAFALMVSAPVDAVMAGVVEIRNRVILVGIVSVLLLVAVVVLLLRRLVGAPLQGIVRGVDAVAAGQLDYPIAAGGDDEVGQVSRALRKMQADLKARLDAERKIAAENLRVRIALDNAGTAMLIAGADGLVAYANPAMRRLLAQYRHALARHLPRADLDTLEGQPLAQLQPEGSADPAKIDAIGQSELALGSAVFAQTAAPVVSPEGERLGVVVEWRDRSQEVAVEAEVGEVIEAAAAGDLSKRIEIAGKSGFFRRLAEGVDGMLDANAGTMSDVQRVLGALAQGDLTQRITADYRGVFGQMRDDTNATVERLTDTMRRVQAAVDAIRTAAREIAAGNSDLSARSEQQAASLEETAASMEELTSTVKNNAESSYQARQLATGAADVASRGGAVVEQVVEQMNGITAASKQIENIIGVIDGIAFQTNILALNAAVEAARAGEQGRGFAVVAGEVRALAQRSAEAAKEIKGLIGGSVERVDQGAALVAQAGGTMQEIVDAVRRVSDLMAEISAASQEQSSGIEQVNQTITHMDGVTQQNAAMVEQASAAAHSLQEQADDLAEVVSVFRMR
ncbi:HAMP domain-containing protein [Thermomonas brevis]|uniref:HAMP domain-containing protein n=1 Tax=Thermomonas brevis TaxID=215691 RepID=A0A7G9QUN4_9GAMM|nr:methyl-accepting chemotaxis protein [Thermomonas brevis]QNN47059.1 HAMP domain-containing protein [Thermomonas brevis]